MLRFSRKHVSDLACVSPNKIHLGNFGIFFFFFLNGSKGQESVWVPGNVSCFQNILWPLSTFGSIKEKKLFFSWVDI